MVQDIRHTHCDGNVARERSCLKMYDTGRYLLLMLLLIPTRRHFRNSFI